jgi:hypothetical protein
MIQKQFSVRSGALALVIIATGVLTSLVLEAQTWSNLVGIIFVASGLVWLLVSFDRVDS